MLSKKDILELDSRRELYNLIMKNPGLHMREIFRRIDLSWGGLRYQLNYLIKQEYIKTVSNQRYKRYYVTHKVGKKDTEIFNLLREDIPCKIVLLLLSLRPAFRYKKEDMPKKYLSDPYKYCRSFTRKELIELTSYWRTPDVKFFRLSKHKSTVSFHLKKLMKANIIEKIKIGKETRYRLYDDQMISRFLLLNRETLSRDNVDTFLNWGEKWLNENMDFLYQLIFDIFPNPYYV